MSRTTSSIPARSRLGRGPASRCRITFSRRAERREISSGSLIERERLYNGAALGLFWFWLIVAGAFVVAEMLTLAFFAVFLAIGALGAALAALLGASLLLQSIIMAVVGVGGIIAVRPYLHRALGRHKPPRLR